MPITLQELTEQYGAAIVEIARAAERAQSERVGPSFLSYPDWEQRRFTLEELQARYPYPTARQPESAPQAQGGRMRFSTKQTPLNDAEKARMKTFFSQVLRDGKASYPLACNRLIIFTNDVGKFIYRDNRWSMSSEYVYIGYLSDEGTGELSDPAARLALTVALMALCDLQNDPELLQLVEQRLAKILAGVYEGAIAPLAERANGEPVSRIAWSTTGGVAALVDGQWTSPVTGEAVAVGEGWVVVETGEGRKVEQSSAPLATSQSAINGREVMERFLESSGFFAETLPDGRRWAEYGGEGDARYRIAQAERDGFPGLVAERNPRGEWGITYPLSSSPAQDVEPMPF